MVSKLSYIEFQKCLENNVKIGNIPMMISPLGIFGLFSDMDKEFFGKYDSKNFKVTLNDIRRRGCYIIKGSYYASLDERTTQVKIKITPVWFVYLWMRTVPIIFFLIINLALLNSGARGIIFLIFDSFLLYMIIWPVIKSRRIKKKMVKRFHLIFCVNND